MKNIKMLWALTLGVFVVLIYAMILSVVVSAGDKWFEVLQKPINISGNTFSILRDIYYFVIIALFTRMVFCRANKRDVSLFFSVLVLSLLWTASGFYFQSLEGAFIFGLLTICPAFLLVLTQFKKDKTLAFLAVLVFVFLAFMCVSTGVAFYFNR